MEDERWKREIVNPIDLARDFHLLQIVTVNFDQHFHPKPMGLCGQSFVMKRKVSGIMKQLVPGFFDGVADCIEPNQTDRLQLETGRGWLPDTLRPGDASRRCRSAAE